MTVAVFVSSLFASIFLSFVRVVILDSIQMKFSNSKYQQPPPPNNPVLGDF